MALTATQIAVIAVEQLPGNAMIEHRRWWRCTLVVVTMAAAIPLMATQARPVRILPSPPRAQRLLRDRLGGRVVAVRAVVAVMTARTF
jgi:hypothetical protein